MHKNGFTLVELITTMVVSSVIIVLLTNIILSLKNAYNKVNAKTELMIEKSNAVIKINEGLDRSDLSSISPCPNIDNCYNFTYSNSEPKQLKTEKNSIIFGDYNYKLPKDSYFDSSNPLQIQVQDAGVVDPNANDSFFIIHIPIYSKQFLNQDLGIKIVYPFNEDSITVITANE